MENEEIFGKEEIKRILNIVMTKKAFIFLIIFTSILVGYVYSFYYVTPMYKSSATIILVKENIENKDLTQSDVTLNQKLVATYSQIAKSDKVLGKVIENLQLNMSTEELNKTISVKSVDNTEILNLIVENNNPSLAAQITNELAKVFGEEIISIYKMDNVNIVDEAKIATAPYNINHIKDLIIALAAGVFLSCAFIVVCYMLDNTIKIEADIEDFTGLNSLIAIPYYSNKLKKTDKKEEINSELIAFEDKKSAISECFRTLRTNLVFTQANKVSKNILISSCSTGEGKSWVSANIASTFANSNKKVLLVDGDLRKGRQHNIFNVNMKPGLSNALAVNNNDIKIEDMDKYIQETKIPNLHIITCGDRPPNPSELLSSNRFKQLLEVLDVMYDVIIIDGTPCNLVSDSIIVSSIIDTTVLVTECRKTKIDDIKKIKKSIESVGGNISGVVVNKVQVSPKEYQNNYYYADSNKPDVSNQEQKDDTRTVKEVIQEALLHENDNYIAVENKENLNIVESTTQEQLQLNEIKQLLLKYILEDKTKENELSEGIALVKEKMDNAKEIYPTILENKLQDIKDTLQKEIAQKQQQQEDILKKYALKIQEQIEAKDDSNIIEKQEELGRKLELAKQNMNKMFDDSMQYYEGVLKGAISDVNEKISQLPTEETLEKQVQLEQKLTLTELNMNKRFDDSMKYYEDILNGAISDVNEKISQLPTDETLEKQVQLEQKLTLTEQNINKKFDDSMKYYEDAISEVKESILETKKDDTIQKLQEEIKSMKKMYEEKLEMIVGELQEKSVLENEKISKELLEIKEIINKDNKTNKKVIDINELKKNKEMHSEKKDNLFKTIFKKEPICELDYQDLEENAIYTCQILNRKI